MTIARVGDCHLVDLKEDRTMLFAYLQFGDTLQPVRVVGFGQPRYNRNGLGCFSTVVVARPDKLSRYWITSPDLLRPTDLKMHEDGTPFTLTEVVRDDKTIAQTWRESPYHAISCHSPCVDISRWEKFNSKRHFRVGFNPDAMQSRRDATDSAWLRLTLDYGRIEVK